MVVRSIVLLLGLWLAASALAGNSGRHLHGVATLNVVVVDNAVVIEWRSPAANLLGFERPPHTADERRALQLALQQHDSHITLLSVVGAICNVVAVTVESPWPVEDEPEMESGHHPGHDDEHTELTARYQLECGGDIPQGLEINAFDYYPALQVIELQWVLPTAQGSQRMTADQSRIRF